MAHPLVFDRARLRRRLARAERQGPDPFLLERVAEDLRDRLDAVMRPFAEALDLGTPGPQLAVALAGRPGLTRLTRAAPLPETHGTGPWIGIVADEEALPFREQFDLVVSALALQGVNDLPGTLVQIRRALRPDGLFLACLAGGQTLIPVLKQSGDLASPLGRHVLGCAAVGELAPLILASIALAHQQHHIHQAFLSLIFLFIAAGLIAFLVKYRTEEHIAKMSYWISEGGVLPFRVTMLVLLGFVSLADSFGMETVVGAYVAGMAIAMLAGGAKDEILERRLTAIGSGFFVPLFFVVSGVTYNLPMLLLNPITLMLFFLFCIVFITIRLAPAGLFRHALSQNDCIAQSLLSSTTLPLVVAITYLGAQTGQMTQETATALVGAAIVTVTLFPTIAFWLRTQSENTLIATYILQKSDFYTRLFLPILDKIVVKIDGVIGRH